MSLFGPHVGGDICTVSVYHSMCANCVMTNLENTMDQIGEGGGVHPPGSSPALYFPYTTCISCSAYMLMIYKTAISSFINYCPSLSAHTYIASVHDMSPQ